MLFKATGIPLFGDHSDDVKVLQTALVSKGLNPGPTDGIYGQKTRQAAAEFQKENGLPGTGRVGPETMRLLGIEIAVPVVIAPDPVSGEDIKIMPDTGKTISSGHDSDEGTLSWYVRMFKAMGFDAGREGLFASVGKAIVKHEYEYRQVQKGTGVHWFVIGLIHHKEASGRFDTVLHNGEKLSDVNAHGTQLVPKGVGKGKNWTWAEAAIDAIGGMTSSRWANLRKGSLYVGDILYALERYNGTGYISGAGKEDVSSYLWDSTTVHDNFGKYVRDGKYDPNYPTNKTAGAAGVLKWLVVNKFVTLTYGDVKSLSPKSIADLYISLINQDVVEKYRETKGKNRSADIDRCNLRVGASLGAPYCTSVAWDRYDQTCTKLGIKNPIPRTASSQRFWANIPEKYKSTTGGQRGDSATFRVPTDHSHGHHATLIEDQFANGSFPTGEYNTDAIKGDRDGDGAYHQTRNTVDKSAMNAGKEFIGFGHLAQWIYDYNVKA